MFGAKSSPTVSTFALRHHGTVMKKDIRPKTFLAIVKSFYVDNVLASYKSV